MMAHCFITPMKTAITDCMWIKTRRISMNPKGTVINLYRMKVFDEMWGNYINAVQLITTTNMLETFTSYGFTAPFCVYVGHTVVLTPTNLSFLWIRTQSVFGHYTHWLRSERNRFLAEPKTNSLRQNVHTGSGAHPASCIIGAGDPFLGINAAEAWNSPSYSSKVKK
jgi:hypothetical protein